MKITRDNLNDVLFENQDARLLIEDIVTHTSAAIYFYHNKEITVEDALDQWHRAYEADSEKEEPYCIVLDFSKGVMPELLYL